MEEVKGLQWYVMVLLYDETAADTASEISVFLEKEGKSIDIRGLFLGAIAKTINKPIITRNTMHFQRIPALTVIHPKELALN